MPAGFTVHKWRAATRSWMEERNDRLKVFGSDYWNFVLNWEVSVITELAMVGALSVLSEVMQVNFEAVALCTTGSDFFEPICSESAWPTTVRFIFGFDPEKHWVALFDQRPGGCYSSSGGVHRRGLADRSGDG